MNGDRFRITRKPQHVPEGWWWLDKQGKVCFNEGKPRKEKV
jgi:hypothetical protein